MPIGRFMGMVGALIWCPSIEKYLILKRSPEKDVGQNTWECGTGRVDQGENFTTALHREVREELGVEIQIDFIIGTAHFYRGEQIPEKEMIGVFYRCSIADPEAIQLSWEHSEYQWITVDEMETYFPTDYWLARLINRAEDIRLRIPPSLLDLYQKTSFEL